MLGHRCHTPGRGHLGAGQHSTSSATGEQHTGRLHSCIRAGVARVESLATAEHAPGVGVSVVEQVHYLHMLPQPFQQEHVPSELVQQAPAQQQQPQQPTHEQQQQYSQHLQQHAQQQLKQVIQRQKQQQAHQQPVQLLRRPQRRAPLPDADIHIQVQQHEQLVLQRPAMSHEQQQHLLQLQVLSQLLRCSRECVEQLIVREPRLVATEPVELHKSLQRLAAALHTQVSRAAGLARKQPMLLFVPYSSLLSKLQAVAQTLGLPQSSCGRLALKVDKLLLFEPQELQQRLTAIVTALEMSPSQVASIVCQRPRILLASSEGLHLRCTSMQQQLNFSVQQLQRILCQSPVLLEYTADATACRIQQLRILLDLDNRRLRSAILSAPSMLTRSPANLAAKLACLAQLCGGDTKAARTMVLQRPELLTRSPVQVNRSFRALSVWKFDSDYKLQMLKEHPLLLRLSPKEVHGRCRWLRNLMMSHAFYHSTLRSIPPAALGVIILHLPKAWRRLQYLAESARESNMCLMAAVQMREEKFSEVFPEYSKWRCWTDGQTDSKACGAPWRSQAVQKQQQLQDQQQQQLQQQRKQQQQRRHPQARSRVVKLAARQRLFTRRQQQQLLQPDTADDQQTSAVIPPAADAVANAGTGQQ